jgi:hypothetical protein
MACGRCRLKASSPAAPTLIALRPPLWPPSRAASCLRRPRAIPNIWRPPPTPPTITSVRTRRTRAPADISRPFPPWVASSADRGPGRRRGRLSRTRRSSRPQSRARRTALRRLGDDPGPRPSRFGGGEFHLADAGVQGRVGEWEVRSHQRFRTPLPHRALTRCVLVRLEEVGTCRRWARCDRPRVRSVSAPRA